MKGEECGAIVIGAMDYREADRIVTLFTLEHGKVRVIARGARKSRRRFAAALELFARIRAILQLRDGLSPLQDADLMTVYPGIRRDLPRIALAGYACELVDQFLPDGMPNPRLFRLLVTLLEHLDRTEAGPSDRRFFEINLLNILGYRPPIDTCPGCGADLAATGGLLAGGGLHAIPCPACGSGGRALSPATVHLLRTSLRTGRFGVVRFPADLLAEAGELLDLAIASHLHRPMKSLAFLREMDRPV